MTSSEKESLHTNGMYYFRPPDHSLFCFSTEFFNAPGHVLFELSGPAAATATATAAATYQHYY